MPNKELFNQTLKNEIALTDRLAVGIPGMEGCDNVTFSKFLKQTAGTLTVRLLNKTTQQTITIPANSKILDFDLYTSGTATAKVTMTDDGDIVSETEFTRALANFINLYLYEQKTFTIDISSGTISIFVRYIPNCY